MFGLILLGYGCARTNLLGERGFEVLNRFVLWLTLPVLTFRTLASVDPRQFVQPALFVAVLGGAASVYALSFLIDKLAGRSSADANVIGLSASFGNTAFIGLPVCLVALGPASLAPAALVIALNAAVIFGVAVALSEVFAAPGQDAGSGVAKAVRIAVLNPVVLSAIAGVAWAETGIPLPGPLDVWAATLAAATAPCALVAIGMFIARPQAHSQSATMARVLILKLTVQPLATLALLLLFPPLPIVWSRTAILLAAMPTGTSGFLIAASAGRHAQDLSARAIVASTLLAIVTLSAVLWTMQTG